jgi:3-hydroxyacyl-[acyl-carrier-protein] dehydratase
MPPQPLWDIAKIDTSKVLFTREQIYQVNPHRFEFMQLDGICLLAREQNTIVGYRDTKPDEFWVRGHIPGRPIFPGVLMIETAAQLVSYYVMSRDPGKGFLGFGGVTDVKFRGSVVPGKRIILVGKMVEDRPRRCVGATQGFVDGQMVYEGLITGMWL